MLTNFRRSLFLIAAITVLPLSAIAFSMPVAAQEAPAEEMPEEPAEDPSEVPAEDPAEEVPADAVEEDAEEMPATEPAVEPVTEPEAVEPAEGTNTVCRYDPDSGFPNALGMRTYVTLTEEDGNTKFVLDRFSSRVSNPDNLELQADVTETRSLTMYNTPIAEARQLMIDQPFYYATLLEVDNENLELDFNEIDKTLVCEASENDPAAFPPGTPPPATPPATTPPATPAPEGESEELDLSALPNGNYRVVSAEFPNRVVTDEELLEAGGAIFLFRKFGDEVTGTYGFIDSEGGSCIAGTLEDNAVTGESFASGDSPREGTFLTLGEPAGERRYTGSVLNLESFSRINAGSRLPVENCP